MTCDDLMSHYFFPLKDIIKESVWTESTHAPLHIDGLEPLQHLSSRLCCRLLKITFELPAEKKVICSLYRQQLDLRREIGYNVGIDEAMRCYVSSVVWGGEKKVMFDYIFLGDWILY